MDSPFTMENRLQIGDRIRALRQKNNFSQSYVAEKLFISQAAYSLIENSQNGIVAQHIVNLSTLYKVSTDFILKGDRLVIKIGQEAGFVPLVKANAHADFLNAYPDDSFFEVSDWFKIPGFNPTISEKLFEIEGDSMAPTLFNGDIVVCQEQKDFNRILDGSLVLLITKKGIFVKRLRLVEGKSHFVIESDNEGSGHEERTIEKSEIIEAMSIRGKISSVLVPHHEIASKGKIRALEESIEFLNKEIFKISKKLDSLK